MAGPPELLLTASAIVFKPGPWFLAHIVGDVCPLLCVTDAKVWFMGGPAPGGWPPEEVAMADTKVYLKQLIVLELISTTT